MQRLLRTSIQRGLFATASFGLAPWFFMRFLSEFWHSSGVTDYLRNVFVEPISPWFESGWWQYAMLEWYDWLVLPSIGVFFLAFVWPYTGARLAEWVRGTK